MDEQPRDLSIGEEAFNIFEKRIASEVAIENAQIEKNIKLRSSAIYSTSTTWSSVPRIMKL